MHSQPTHLSLIEDKSSSQYYIQPNDTFLIKELRKNTKILKGEQSFKQVSSKGFLVDSIEAGVLQGMYYSYAYRNKTNNSVTYVLPRIILSLKEGCHIEDIVRKYSHVFRLEQCVKGMYFLQSNLTVSTDVIQLVKEISQQEEILWCEPEMLFELNYYNTYYNNQYYLKNTGQNGYTSGIDINAEEAWSIAKGNPDIVVAVIDQGVEPDHEDLIGNVIDGYTISNPSGLGVPQNEGIGLKAHGVACAGIIGAINNTIGICGVASGVKILPVNISPYYISEGNSGFGSNAEIATAILWAADRADVLSCSWGGGSESASINSAISYARTSGRSGKGCPVIFASGNSYGQGSNNVAYPGRLDGVITVGAVDGDGMICNYSQRGPSMDLVAPSGMSISSGDIVTTDRMGSSGYNIYGNYTNTFGGTSAACPQVAGVAALMLSVRPDLTETQVRTTLQNTARDLGVSGFDNTYGYGLVNAGAAVKAIAPQIIGPSFVSDSASYYVDNLDQSMHVVWSKQDVNVTMYLYPDDPAVNQCKVKRIPVAKCEIVLLANIYVGSTHVCTVSKRLCTPPNNTGTYSQEQCVYYNVSHPAIVETSLDNETAHFVHQGCLVQVTSDYIQPMSSGIDVTWSGVTPNNWLVMNDNHKLLFSLPLYSGGIPFYVHFGNYKSVLFFSMTGNNNLFSLIVQPTSNGYQLSLEKNEALQSEVKQFSTASKQMTLNENTSWNLKVYEVGKGIQKHESQIIGKEYFLNTTSWPSGTYVIIATLNGETYSHKITIK